VSDPFRDREASAEGGREVILFADTLNRYFEPENLRAAVRVLRAAGYIVRPATDGGRPLCCGRTYLAAGMVDSLEASPRARWALDPTIAATGAKA
jgi:Fe-S oxidoreductase